MSSEYASESENRELRKRAAWLLGMLVLVAALFVVLFVTFFDGSGGGNTDAGPTGSVAISQSPTHPPTHTPGQSSGRTAPISGGPTTGAPTTPSGTATGPTGAASCPTQQPCVVAGDVGNAIGAINDYRTAHGKPVATGTVSAAAQQCALSNGDMTVCSGSWAESQVPNGTGAAALQKIMSRGHVLSDFSSFAVGWAYDPGSKQYFFALILTR